MPRQSALSYPQITQVAADLLEDIRYNNSFCHTDRSGVSLQS